jgi:thioredoxin-related protein
MPIVNGVEREYGRRINVIYVSMDEPEGLDFARGLGVVGTPTILLLDEDGLIINSLRGVVADVQVEQAVDAALTE